MATVKTLPTKASVATFIKTLPRESQKEAQQLLALMKKATGQKPVLWGTAIIGFGMYEYTDASKKKSQWPKTAYAMRKSGPVVYIMPGFASYASHLKKLGSPKHGGSCLYLKTLSTIDTDVLIDLIRDSYAVMTKRYAVGKKV
jgi:hypothetical protein